MPSRLTSVALALLLASSFVLGRGATKLLGEEPPQFTIVDGEALRGSLTSCDAEWQLKFGAPADKQLSAAELVTWGQFVETARGAQIVLPGGGLLVADVISIDRAAMQTESTLCGEVKLPLSAALGIVFHPPHDRDQRDDLVQRVATASGDQDQLLLDNGDTLSGTLINMKEQVLTLQTASGNVDLEVGRVAALVLNPALANRPPAGLRAMVGLKDGSRMVATRLISDGDKARLAITSKLEITVPLASIVALQTLGGRAVYLSDRKPTSYRHIPFLSLAWPYFENHNVLGRGLRAGGRLWLKGLGMHTAARLTYDLDGEYKQFQAEAAVDDAAAGGSVVFRVFVDDGSGAWQAKYTSDIVRGGQSPSLIAVDLAGAKRISLLVEFADRGDQRDYADWLGARLVK